MDKKILKALMMTEMAKVKIIQKELKPMQMITRILYHGQKGLLSLQENVVTQIGKGDVMYQNIPCYLRN